MNDNSRGEPVESPWPLRQAQGERFSSLLECGSTNPPSGLAEDIRVAITGLDAGLAIVDDRAFEDLVEKHRPELQFHCYRMLGSVQESEDLVQESLLRAWKSREAFEGRSSIRTWLYSIATHVCLDALRRRSRRILVTAYGPPSDPSLPDTPPPPEVLWLEPFPDRLLNVVDQQGAPEARYDARESVELAFLAAVQCLQPRQRAILLLRDALSWTAAETAALLETSVASVNSGLLRARAAMRRQLPKGADSFIDGIASEEAARAVADRYLRAWEAADVHALAALLKEDATLSMPPVPSWYFGRSAVAEFLARNPMSPQWHARLRVYPTRANRRPAFAVYHRGPGSDVFSPFGLMTLRIEGDLIAEILGFIEPALFRFFDVPAAL